MSEFANNYSSITKLLGAKAFEDKEKAASAMPTTYIKGDLPPFFIVQGDEDKAVPYSDSELLYETLKSNGSEVEIIIVKGEGHKILATQPHERTFSFFDRILKGME